jgi:alkanesulfonate monooxygenase SsuD/methylene tetrahydromethanopterin reductase-like flavin-dependent oxidoreductase (luciferase family)
MTTIDKPFFLGISVLTFGATWPSAVETVRLADRLGYDGIFTADHLYANGGDLLQPLFEGWTTLAGWSQVTQASDLGLLVGANTFRNPGVVAKMTATLDHMSDGRAILGLGAAWDELEQRAHGIDVGRSQGQRIDWLDESLGLIRRVLAGEEVTYESDAYRFDRVRHAPLPLRQPVPVIVGASGEKKGLRIVARHADLWQFWSPIDGVPEFRRLDGVLRQHCDDVGRDQAAIRRIPGAKLILRDRRSEADAVFEQQLTVQPWSGDVLEFIANSDLWRPTPAEMVDALGAFQASGGAGFIAQFYPPYDHETIERLATQVAPQLGWTPRAPVTAG